MIKLVCLVKAKPGQTAEEFKRRWLEDHSKFAASWKNIKSYRINLPVPAIHARKGDGALLDGVGELCWDTYEEMIEDFESARGVAGFADAAEFMDLALNLYCEEHIIK